MANQPRGGFAGRGGDGRGIASHRTVRVFLCHEGETLLRNALPCDRLDVLGAAACCCPDWQPRSLSMSE